MALNLPRARQKRKNASHFPASHCDEFHSLFTVSSISLIKQSLALRLSARASSSRFLSSLARRSCATRTIAALSLLLFLVTLHSCFCPSRNALPCTRGSVRLPETRGCFALSRFRERRSTRRTNWRTLSRWKAYLFLAVPGTPSLCHSSDILLAALCPSRASSKPVSQPAPGPRYVAASTASWTKLRDDDTWDRSNVRPSAGYARRMGKTASKLKSRRSQSIAWSFRFPSMGTLQNLGASGRRRKRNGVPSSTSCKDLHQKRHTIHLQPEVIIQKEPSFIVTPPSPEDPTAETSRSSRLEEAEEELVNRREDGCETARRVDSNDYSNLPMEPPEESTRKLLERELRLLDPRDLRSHAWYHGSTLRGGRKGAEAEVPNDGDFLVRDCASQPGNYVLTVRWKGQPLHFVINRVVIQPETVYERAQYQFEDEAFDTVADLITFYVGSGRPISQASGARIITPKPRCVPLTCVPGPTSSQHCSSPSSSSLSTGSPPRLPRKQQRSHSLTAQHHTSDQHDVRQTSNQQPAAHGPIQSSTLPRVPPIQSQPPSCSLSLGRQKITRVISDPALQQQQQPILQPPNLNHQNSHGTAPPKPPRVPYAPNHQHHAHHHHHHHHHHHQGYQASGSDSGNGSGDSEFETNNSGGASNPSSSAPIKGVVIRSQYNTSNDGTNGNNGNEYELSVEEQLVVAAPSLEIPTALDIEGFTTLLLPAGEHRPLDPTALRGVSGMLHDSAPRVLASHLTKIDLELALHPGSGNRNGLSGIELATLPHGRQARMDLIERSECLKLVVAVTVLAGATAIERAATISKWIKVAIDTKTALGNLYGFCGVMLGLCLPQIQRLANTWHLLRQKHTDEAFSFEAKLRPTLRAMNECTNPQAPNTTLPHLLPVALLGERGPEDILGTVTPSGLAAAILSPWENSAPDCGLSIVWSHLESARKMAENLALFRRNAEIVLEGSRSDELLSDAFRTEFHIKFLWGSRGATVAPEERHLKFTQVLDAMFDKCSSSEVAA